MNLPYLNCHHHLRRMPYTEATLLEVQRYATVVPLFSRANIEDQYIGDYVIPKVNSLIN